MRFCDFESFSMRCSCGRHYVAASQIYFEETRKQLTNYGDMFLSCNFTRCRSLAPSMNGVHYTSVKCDSYCKSPAKCLAISNSHVTDDTFITKKYDGS